MANALRADRRPVTGPAIGLAVLSALLVLAATRHGPGTSADSASYIAAARNLTEGRGVTDYTGVTLTTWPPGFPAALAVGLELGVSVGTTARALNALSMAAIVLLSNVLLRRHVRSPWAVLVGTALVAVSPTLLRTADMVWSEPLFCASLLGFVVLAEQMVHAPRHRDAYLVLCSTMVWAAALVRWVGLALIPAGMIALVVGTRPEGRLRRVLGFAAVAGFVPALWLVRNATRGDEAMGARRVPHHGLSDVVRTVLEGIARLVVPQGVPSALDYVVATALLGAFAVGAVFAFQNPGETRRAAAPGWPLTPLVATVVCSVAISLGSYLLASTDWSVRIIAPVYAPLVVIGFVIYERLQRPIASFVTAVSVAWLAFVIVWAAGLVWDHGRHTRGYLSPMWTTSEVIRASRGFARGLPLYTNVPLPVVVVTDRYPVRDVRALPSECHGAAAVAFYGRVDRPPAPLRRANVELTSVRRVTDGTLYQVRCDT